MKRTAGLKFTKYVSFTQEEFTGVIDLVKKYCDDIRFESETKDGSKIEFDSFDELVNYSNYGKDKIKSLDVHAYTGHGFSSDKSIHIQFGNDRWEKETVRCSYSFKNKDDETVFKQEMLSILEKNSGIQKTYITGYILSLVLFVLLLGKLFIPTAFSCFLEKAFGLGIFILLLMFGLAWGASALFNLVWKKAFSPVVFAWGEEKKYEEKMIHIRNNIIWGIIIASIVSVILSFVL